MYFDIYKRLDYHMCRINGCRYLQNTYYTNQYKLFYNHLILLELNWITNILYQSFRESKDNASQTKESLSNTYPAAEFTLSELAKFDGSGGKPAYVAVNGAVYDVSLSPVWGGGSHFGLIAGKDLTRQFAGCHDKEDILKTLPKIGVLRP